MEIFKKYLFIIKPMIIVLILFAFVVYISEDIPVEILNYNFF